jgi:ferrous iron transport protein A
MEQENLTLYGAEAPQIVPAECMPLGVASRGFSGRIHVIQVGEGRRGLPATELERRLLELGFIEGAEVTVLHEGPVGRDPLAVRVNGTTIALRRQEAMAIFVMPSGLSK